VMYLKNSLSRSFFIRYNLMHPSTQQLHDLSPRVNSTDERPPLVGDVIANFCRYKVLCGQHGWPHGRILGFLDLLISATRSRVSLLIMLRHCATSRKVAWSRPGEVNDFFLKLPNPSSCTRPWGFSAYNRNEYQKQNNNVSGE
jgi:hypothetical protein